MSKERIKEFAKENWPKVVAATTAGATIILLIKYYRKKRKDNLLPTDRSLNVSEKEAGMGEDEVATLLETGVIVMSQIPDSSEIMEHLSDGIEDPAAQETMKTLSDIGKRK